jgi:dephospho-CoA kinase
MAKIIGLTGGIGSGKSTASAILAEAGVPIVDADAVSRSLTAAGGEGSAAVAAAFGPEFLTPEGAMDRARMRALAFSDKGALRKLESVFHPLIGRRIRRELASHAAAPVAVFDCPLLYRESFRLPEIARILVIDASDETRLRRILSRPGITPETARRMMAAQPPRTRWLSFADDVIVNEGTPEELREKVLALLARWKAQ